MENLNAEQAINELEKQTKYAKFIKSKGVLISAKCAQFVLEHVQYYEQRIKELTEEIKDLTETVEVRGKVVGQLQILTNEIEEDNRKLTEKNERLQKHNAVLIEDNHILSSECIQMAKADTVRKMQERLKAHFDTYTDEDETNALYMRNVIDRVAKEMLEDKK